MITTHKLYLYETYFVVSGDMELPLDMLRYDCAFPASEEDARRAEHEFGRRAVALVSRRPANNGPMKQRWASFGWRVEAELCADVFEARDLARKLSTEMESEVAKKSEGSEAARG